MPLLCMADDVTKYRATYRLKAIELTSWLNPAPIRLVEVVAHKPCMATRIACSKERFDVGVSENRDVMPSLVGYLLHEDCIDQVATLVDSTSARVFLFLARPPYCHDRSA